MNKKILFVIAATLLSLTSCKIKVLVSSESSSNVSSETEISSSYADSSSNSISSEVKISSETSSNNLVSSVGCSLSSVSMDTNAPVSGNVNLSIVEINDLHGYAYSASYNTQYNLANAAYYVDKIRNEEKYDNVVLIANGDMFQGTAFSNLSYGASVIKAMNTMDFDMMGIGNHEFDWTLDKVLAYWDGDESNTEANFPLLNGNVRDSADSNKLVGESNTEDNILPYTIVNKGGINVGLISYIGDQTSSICANKFGSYYIDCYGDNDTNFIANVRSQAIACKKAGADIIVLNFHEGNSDGISELAYNQSFAKMQDDDGNYLIDAVINGHTHTMQNGEIEREGGNSLPVVQAGSYCNAIGVIRLSVDAASKKVTSLSENTNYYDGLAASDKKDSTQAVLEEEYAKIEPLVSDVLASSTGATKNQLAVFASNVMKQYTSADVAFINYGGIRATLKSGDITMEEMYAINPFDNSLCLFEATGSELISFYNKNSSYQAFNSGFSVSDIESNETYKITTIDYVYYGSFFTSTFTNAKEIKIDNDTCARDLMVLDFNSRSDKTVDFSSTVVYVPSNTWPSK